MPTKVRVHTPDPALPFPNPTSTCLRLQHQRVLVLSHEIMDYGAPNLNLPWSVFQVGWWSEGEKLPSGYRAMKTAQGKWFFINDNDKSTSWQPPPKPVAVYPDPLPAWVEAKQTAKGKWHVNSPVYPYPSNVWYLNLSCPALCYRT